jgi:response regulator RpfG family c-di-GMP phosphodiesterase
MAELSPQTQAVIDAFSAAACQQEYKVRSGVAAALRAAADQAVPHREPRGCSAFMRGVDEMSSEVRGKLLRIATELEGER